MQTRVPNIIAALRALGEILDSQGETVAVVVVGGAALIMQGFVARVTQDVDVIAISRETQELNNRDISRLSRFPNRSRVRY